MNTSIQTTLSGKRRFRFGLMRKMMMITAVASFGFLQCNRPGSGQPIFEMLRKDVTGLDFENLLHQTSEFNVFNYMYFFNGGGVAAGDFNNDGLIDLYFTANMGANKMFLNQGGMKFKDVTEVAGVAGTGGWKTGVSVVDINNDGLLDLYVGELGEYQSIRGRNQLFICKGIENGVPVYEDEAIYYGLDLTGFSTQAVFFDYDGDGDLDMFQLNHSLHQNGTFGPRKNFEGTMHPMAGDKLFRNDTPRSGDKKPVFTEVTKEAGILSTVIGYGLGVATGDFNNDGFPDLYIGNDFHENDYLYLNQGDGTFKEVSRSALMHTSQYSMGVDIADFNNDGWDDIISLDMLPEDPVMLKTSLGEDTYNLFLQKVGYGYYYQYTRNNLQLNNGDGTFSEIGLFAGVAATDWSWSPLFMDFDNDGKKDLFISNGIPRRMNDIDYVKFQENRELKLKGDSRSVVESELDLVEKMPRVKLPNKFFHNSGQLRFDDVTANIKSAAVTFSNGAIYADLDNDGDLDVVVNNLEDEPFIYRNLSNDHPAEKHDFLSFDLKGSEENIHGIGTNVLIYKKNGEKITSAFYPVRGFLSSAQIPLHIGVGDSTLVDSIVVIWPDRTFKRLDKPTFNRTQTLAWKPGLPVFDYHKIQYKDKGPFAFEDITAQTQLNFKHVENPFIEFNREPLIPNMVSREGPALAVGDVNGDGLEDVFFGSALREKSALYLQQKDGTFQLHTPEAILKDSIFEDVDAVFADIDNDGDLDLVIASGGNEFSGKEPAMKQRAYLNDGKGNFTIADPFPDLYMTASCVLPVDFNHDGKIDFFFGGRSVPWKYGVTPNSYLMQNMGNGRFEDVTRKIAPGLQEIGLVKNGTWADLDGDGDPDLLLALEWGPITAFINQGNHFEQKPLATGSGWWNFVVAGDFDGDGDIDILAGNTGMNSRFHPTPAEPVRMYVNDFDDNGRVDQILTYYVKGKEIPFANFEELTKALPMLKKKYLYSKDLAKGTIADIFGKDKLSKSILREADNFVSTYFENVGPNLTYKAHPLPDELQFSTLNAGDWADLNGDGKKEMLLGGNFYECNIEMGRYDAFFGRILTFGKDGAMQSNRLGNLIVKGQTRRIRPITIAGKPCFIYAQNNDQARVVVKKGDGGR
jgi:hypothetical protein